MDNDDKRNENKEHENKMNFHSLISGYMKDENMFIACDPKEKVAELTLNFGVSGHGHHVGPWDILPLCPNCSKKSLWIYPEGHIDIENVPVWGSFDSSKIYVACKKMCGFKTKAFSEVRECLKSCNLV